MSYVSPPLPPPQAVSATIFAAPPGAAQFAFGVQPRYGNPYMAGLAAAPTMTAGGLGRIPSPAVASFENSLLSPPTSSLPSTMPSYESMLSPSTPTGQTQPWDKTQGPGLASYESMVVYPPAGTHLGGGSLGGPGLVSNESMIAYPGYLSQPGSNLSSDTYMGRVKGSGMPTPERTKVTKKKIGCCTSTTTTEVKVGKRKSRTCC